MLDKETVRKMVFSRLNTPDVDIDDEFLICINKVEELIDDDHPLNECINRIKDIAR